MPTPTTHDEHGTPTKAFKRLPSWAQKEIMSLKRKAAEAEAYAREALLTVSDPSTRVFLAHFERPDIPLPPDARVLFKLADGVEIEVAVHDVREGSISVRTGGLAAPFLGCFPESSNVVRVGVVPR
jgi:hypothetical protein